MKVKFNTTIDPQLLKDVKLKALKNDTTLSAIINKAFNLYLEQEDIQTSSNEDIQTSSNEDIQTSVKKDKKKSSNEDKKTSFPFPLKN